MMDEFLNKLSEDQAKVALEIARKAKQMGIDPKLAVVLAYRESRLNPNTKNGTSGEIGLMQVKPATAEMMGFSADDLRDPAKNIEIGLTYLKQGLDKFGEPELAVAGYNAGHNHPYFTDPQNKSLPESTKEYLREISENGGFDVTPAPEPEPSLDQTPPAPASEDDFMANKSRIALNIMGAGAGAGIAKTLDVGKNIGETARAIRQMPGALATATQAPPAAPSAPGATSPQVGARPVVGGPAGPVGGPPAPLTQMGGSATANYGKAFGLTDIEANRALDMTKNPGGVHDLSTQRTQALQKIQQMGGGYTENPRYGGIMTPEPSAGGGPRASFVQSPSGLSQLPPAQPVPSAPIPPKGPGPLSQIAGAAKQGAGAVLRSPVTMGALGGLSMAEGAQEAQKRYSEGDMPGALIAGAGAFGGGMQMIPSVPTKAVGAMISAASPLTLYLYDKMRGQKPEEPTPEEMMAAQRPAFMYARP